MVCQVLFSETALFHVCTAIINKFQEIYKGNGDIIGFDLCYDLDIVHSFGFILYIISLLI